MAKGLEAWDGSDTMKRLEKRTECHSVLRPLAPGG